jgi:hypothetical protein
MESNVQTTPVAEVSNVRKEVKVGAIEVSRVYPGNYQKEGTLTAELKQTIETKSFYPSKSVRNNLQDNPFGNEEFEFEEQVFDSKETRVAWIDVPAATFDTEEKVAKRMESIPGATLYRILSNKPSISDAQQAGITSGQTTLDIIANAQVVRYPKNTKVGDTDVSGQIVLDVAGKPQYRGIYYSNTPKSDIDIRTADVADFYTTPEITAELSNTPAQVKGQSITL